MTSKLSVSGWLPTLLFEAYGKTKTSWWKVKAKENCSAHGSQKEKKKERKSKR
jgi:hypothetical protein